MGAADLRLGPALVIFSGGQDSTVCLLEAIRTRGAGQVGCITFRYGQRHDKEVEVAAAIASDLGIAAHKIVDLGWYAQLTASALLEESTAIQSSAVASCPNSVVDGRNMLFLLLAAIHAKSLGIGDVIIGVSEVDFSGYPDCRAEFIRSCNATLNLAMEYEFNVLTPLMRKTKAEVWRMADELGALEYVMEQTLTCYNGLRGRGCATCPACLLRNRGLGEYLATRRHTGRDG